MPSPIGQPCPSSTDNAGWAAFCGPSFQVGRAARKIEGAQRTESQWLSRVKTAFWDERKEAKASQAESWEAKREERKVPHLALQQQLDGLTERMDEMMNKQDAFMALMVAKAGPSQDTHDNTFTYEPSQKELRVRPADLNPNRDPRLRRSDGDEDLVFKQDRPMVDEEVLDGDNDDDDDESRDSEDSEDRRRRNLAASNGLNDMHRTTAAQQAKRRRSSTKLRKKVRSRLESSSVEIAIAIIIFTNSLLIGAEIEYQSWHPGSSTKVFKVLDLIYTLIFLGEFLVRMWSTGVRRLFCRKHDWAWNVLDLFTVLTALVEAGVTWTSELVGVGDVDNLRIVRIVRIARVGKALRIQRIIRFVSALRTLVYSIVMTLKSLVWALILLVLIMYIFSIVITQYTLEHITEHSLAEDHKTQIWWSSLGTSILTLFQSVTGGVSWYEVVEPLWDISVLLPWVFITYVFLITFAVFNVVTGIFCNSAIETAQRDPDLAAQAIALNKRKYIEGVKKLFRSVDEDNSGIISLQELESVVKDEHVRAYFAAMDLDLSDAWTLFKLIDVDKTNIIDERAFVQGCLRLRGNARRLDCAALLHETKDVLKRLSSFMKYATIQFSRLGERAV